MPYLGNQHNVGDHVNNFKVLDDISSHTATFDGSATSVVSAADDTIRIPLHRFIQGQRVTYTNGGGGNIGGLTTGTAYFISFDTPNTIKLATTLANANSNTVINLSAVGSGTSHTLNAAFDGVNTKFKITYRGGTSARLNNATQLNVAINNVIQRPNQSALSFTEGFAIEDNHKIVFKVAPTVNDIFWGSIIANTIENFDLRDNEVDNFTGDGSITEFTLSTIPANNESVIVTIDGVLQHPSDKDTTRAYTLIDSILQFTAAPALNAEIQARHIGFAGASTPGVSGFYGRTGNVVLGSTDHITTGDITSRNINASGIITAASANFGGNVSIGGTLTYEDVTNIDSVGLITARNGIKVSTGTATTALVVDGDARVTGILTVGTSSLKLDGPNNLVNVGTALTLGHSQGVQFHTQNLHSAGFEVNQINASGVITATSFVGSGAALTGIDATAIKDSGGNVKIQAQASGAVYTGIHTFNSDLDVDGHTNLDNVSIAGVSTTTRLDINSTTPIIDFLESDGNPDYRIYTEAGAFVIRDQTNVVEKIRIVTSGVVLAGVTTFSASTHVSNANGSVFFGAGSATAYGSQGGIGRASHTNYHINSSAPGDLCIAAEGSKRIVFGTKAGTGIGGISKRMSIASSGNVSIDHDLDVDGHTNLDNVSIAGVVTATSFVGGLPITNGADNRVITATGANAIQGETGLTFDGNNFEVTATSGRIKINSTGPAVNFIDTNADSDYMLQVDGGIFKLVDLTNSDAIRLQVASNGNVAIAKDLDVDGHTNLDNVSIAGVSTFAGNVNATGVVDVTGSIIVDHSGGGTGLSMNGVSGQTCGVVRQRDDMQHAIIFRGSSNADGSTITGGNTMEYREYGDHVFKTGAINQGERLRITQAGNIGIGTDIPAKSLEVTSNTTPQFQVGMSNNSARASLMHNGSHLYFDTTTGDQVFRTSGTSEKLRIESWGGIQNNQGAIYGGGGANEPKVHFNGAAPSADADRGQFAVSDSAAYNASPIARISLVTRYNSSGGYTFMGGIEGGKENTTDNNFDGFVRLMVRKHGQGNIERLRIDSTGQVLPGADDAQNLGSSTKRWKNIYAADMHFSNKGKTNDVDDTWGDWTLQEGEDSIFMINNRTGKKYSITMKEVN